jgi:acetyl esterase
MAEILSGAPPLTSLEVEAMRAHARADKAPWNDGVATGLDVVDGSYTTPAGPRPIRSVTPPAPATMPILHVHGGGWTICDLETHLALFAGLARAAHRQVMAPHHRRAPEHPYPAPLDDTVAALHHASQAHSGGFFLSGDSAGANLAIAALLRLRDAGERPPVRAVLAYYGCYRRRFDTASHRQYGDGRFGLSTEKMGRFWCLYCNGDATPPHADLSAQDLGHLPPVQIHAAEADPLFDDSTWLHGAIQSAGGQSELIQWPGMTHGFLHYLKVLPQARAAFEASAAYLASHAQRKACA